MKHTKGKWYLQEYTDEYTNIIRSDNGKGFETLYVASAPNREDAKLIPKIKEQHGKMLETLKTLLQCYTDECRIPNVKVVHETQSLLKEIS